MIPAATEVIPVERYAPRSDEHGHRLEQRVCSEIVCADVDDQPTSALVVAVYRVEGWPLVRDREKGHA